MSENSRRLKSNKPPLFSPIEVKYKREGSSGDTMYKLEDGSAYEDTSMGLTSSFKYNPPGTGLRSTQQLNIDWSNFENHTFFNSAQVKTNIAFDKIINSFPFDGKRKEVELFFDKLTGYEKWIYNSFPKRRGYLYFSGSAEGVASDMGTYVTVKDYAGAQYPTISSKYDGTTILEPGLNSMTIETQIYIPSQSLGDLNQTVLHKDDGNNTGFAIIMESLTGSSQANVSMMVVSGASGQLEDKVTLPVEYNQWNHVAWVWDRTPGIQQIYGYLNGQLYNSSSAPFFPGNLGTSGQNLYIGSGSNLGTYSPNTTLSGALDELRLWHGTRTADQINQYKNKLVWPEDNLKLYFKFNEPSGSNTNIVLDYAGNSLHGKLNTNAVSLGIRDIPSGSLLGESPMINEALDLCPVLFPQIEESLELRTDLLVSASSYDDQNPNLITKLIPPHYLEEGSSAYGYSNLEGDIVNTNNNGEKPGENILGGTQAMLALLYTWAKFFDEMKLYLQAFVELNHLSYDNEDTIPYEFLSTLARKEGLELPPLFVGSNIEQYIEGQNLQSDISHSTLGLQQIQNELWKRILINVKDIVRSKGTLHSIKSFMRAAGVNPDNTFRIREFGGPTRSSFDFAREKRFESTTMLNFVSGGFVTTEMLTSSLPKIEPGWPYDGISSNEDRILTSGSFTIEASYKFLKTINYNASQSLARLTITGSAEGETLLNVVAVTGSIAANPSVTLYASPCSGSDVDYLATTITGADLFDGDIWYVSCGRFRDDDPHLDNSSVVSSSYFLRLAKNKNGEIQEMYTTSSYLFDRNCTFSSNDDYSFGPFLQIGSASLNSGDNFLENSIIPSTAKTTTFEGKVTQIRFWSKGLYENEWKEHVRNYRSVGVEDAKVHFNFTRQNVTGSWQRLRLDASTDQITLDSNSSGEINLTDFTQNGLGMSGSNFPTSTTVILPEHIHFSYLSPKIDQGVTDKKVRARSYIDSDLVDDNPWAELAPVYKTNPFKEVTDSTKLTIDFSIVDALDQDIITIFSNLDEMNNAVGRPELMFSEEYKDLEILRDIYFNKLEDKMNLKGFFSFYKWLDTNIGTFIEQLLPKKTKYLGMNYVIESHMLERSKVTYKFEDIYTGEDIRSGLRDRILLQLITARIDRF